MYNTPIFEGKRILVTGGTGSMGQILVRRILAGERGVPSKVIVFSRDESKQYTMRTTYLQKVVGEDTSVYDNFNRTLEFQIGDIRSYPDITAAIGRADIVINAAALKQVPTCEYFPHQGVLTNCLGAQNIVQAIAEHNFPVETVVGISTDKAAKPVNVMGMTKAIQERIFTSANILNKKTRFCCVRYGNVMASRGSVIPLFLRQISQGGPVTVTHPQMGRFLINLNQAVDTVLAAIDDALPGETFVPLAPAATVENIARALIGERKISIEVTGIRPGEKMHEILVSEEEIHHTVKKGNYYAIKSMLPELNNGLVGDKVLQREYSSADHLLDFSDTVKLLRENHLLDCVPLEKGEILR